MAGARTATSPRNRIERQMKTFAEILKGLDINLYALECAYCRTHLENRVILSLKTEKVYCSEGCHIWDEARHSGLVR